MAVKRCARADMRAKLRIVGRPQSCRGGAKSAEVELHVDSSWHDLGELSAIRPLPAASAATSARTGCRRISTAAEHTHSRTDRNGRRANQCAAAVAIFSSSPHQRDHAHAAGLRRRQTRPPMERSKELLGLSYTIKATVGNDQLAHQAPSGCLAS
jgi:hypothetical protein